MAMSTTLSCVAALLAVSFLAPPEPDVSESYRRLHEAGDSAGLADLWLQNPGAILVTIDADLEASLSVWEGSRDAPETEQIAALHARALWGAEIASDVSGRAIFADYAAAFTGWNDEQKVSFRAGQAAFGASRKAEREGDAEAALKAAEDCRDLALPLGDWWGGAMGLSRQGHMLLMLDRAEEAIAPLGEARLLYHQLGLTGSEYGTLNDLVAALVAVEAWPRVRVSAAAAVKLATQLDDADGLRALLGTRRDAEQALGMHEAAAATSSALEELDG